MSDRQIEPNIQRIQSTVHSPLHSRIPQGKEHIDDIIILTNSWGNFFAHFIQIRQFKTIMVKFPSQAAAQLPWCVGSCKEIYMKYYLRGKPCALVDLYCLSEGNHKGEIRVVSYMHSQSIEDLWLSEYVDVLVFLTKLWKLSLSVSEVLQFLKNTSKGERDKQLYACSLGTLGQCSLQSQK